MLDEQTTKNQNQPPPSTRLLELHLLSLLPKRCLVTTHQQKVTMKIHGRILSCLLVLVVSKVIASTRQPKVSSTRRIQHRGLSSRRYEKGRLNLALDLLDSDRKESSIPKQNDNENRQGNGTKQKKGRDDDDENESMHLQQRHTTSSKSKKGTTAKSAEEPSPDSEEMHIDSEEIPVDSEEMPIDSGDEPVSHAPSYGPHSGKGKGKGGKSSKKKKHKSTSEKKSSKKLKTSKSSKSSKSSSQAPVLPPSGDPETRPPTPTRPPGPNPTPDPAPTPSPGSPTLAPDDRPVIRGLTPYGLDYTVSENDRIPFRSEYLEVVELTRMYLAGYFNDIFEDTDATILNEFLTIFTGSSFNFGQPIWIEYGSSAVFDSSSSLVPTVEQLDTALAAAFKGENLNGYIGMLQSLPPGNVFSTTIFVNQTEAGQETRVASSQKRATASISAGTAAGAAGIMLLAAGLLYYRRQLDGNDDECTVDKKSPANSSMTVAGETYAGWTVDQESEAQPFTSSHYRSDSTIHDLTSRHYRSDSTIHDVVDEGDDSEDETNGDDNSSDERDVAADTRSYHTRSSIGLNWDGSSGDEHGDMSPGNRSYHARSSTGLKWEGNNGDEHDDVSTDTRSYHARSSIGLNWDRNKGYERDVHADTRSYHDRSSIGLNWDSNKGDDQNDVPANTRSNHVRSPIGLNWDGSNGYKRDSNVDTRSYHVRSSIGLNWDDNNSDEHDMSVDTRSYHARSSLGLNWDEDMHSISLS